MRVRCLRRANVPAVDSHAGADVRA
jgi:hypothetical protein